MYEIVLNTMAVLSLYCVIHGCLKHKTERDLDEASMIPFADDPDVARRVEQATGKKINAVQMSEPRLPKAGWGTLDI